ncbi:MAG: NusA-like transcription termination signal-binding factor [Desulfurococcales archaeon]|nr:NusA-like transcription termination signal-binding factor [Desulfurococcales archaeon]
MPEDRITIEEWRLLSIFQEFTGAVAYRCIEDVENNKLYFLVNPADIGKAIGKRGINVKMLSKMFGKQVEIVPYRPDMTLEEFLSKLLMGARIISIKSIEKNKEKRLIVKVEEADKGKAIGRGGRNIERARKILKTLYGIDKVIIS